MKYNYFCRAMGKSAKIVGYIRKWRLKHLNEREVLLILSFVVGLLSGFAAIILKNLIHLLGKFLTQNFTSYSENYLYLGLPWNWNLDHGSLCAIFR